MSAPVAARSILRRVMTLAIFILFGLCCDARPRPVSYQRTATTCVAIPMPARTAARSLRAFRNTDNAVRCRSSDTQIENSISSFPASSAAGSRRPASPGLILAAASGAPVRARLKAGEARLPRGNRRGSRALWRVCRAIVSALSRGATPRDRHLWIVNRQAPSDSRPSSLILRVSVLRPQPSKRAAS